jgi:hypothetical protein
MKKAIHTFTFLFVFVLAGAQTDTSFRPFKTIRGDIAGFTVDNLDNIYLLSSTNQVKKLNANGDSMAVFNDVKKYGKATLIDVSNPLKVLLYYRDFATIVILDRLLNVRNTIDLRKQNILQVRAIGQSYDNKIWVYDEMENKLKKIDEDGKLLLETPDFRLLFGEALVPQKIFDQDQYVYVYDSAKAVFVFDYYGALKNKIPIIGWKNFKVSDKFIYGSTRDSMHRYNITGLYTQEWKIPSELAQSISFNFTSARLYAMKKGSIEIYSFQ